ncbi:two-component system, cell cycle sensor histidine kinase and response regulator CckA [Thalassospira xiamenensis M-5 = DSM 17429]|uniref:histidine kinase n=1 Tax=Thalassospira xiamenensis M-5 = DSM 17429 TaxID=1123366 RepID=A0AB72U9X0_9PROT|nr:PAS domain-containing sensor histidine kinase [Thalassospira xiamenensis]AJD50919.1 Signal transduction histidine kinase [Thalassospira xiamenensis M-5 = DSM 17429]SIT24675.1 two-component system, cell cycle sensor histidine kinase and response regulator CckA [Thalassospira xiamenensis M-5 = DSM 17429]
MLFRGIILAVSVAFVAFVYVLLQVMAKAGLDARIMWIIGSMVTGVAIVAVAALSLSARWRSSTDRDLAPLLSGLSHSDIGVALIDAYGRTLYANPAFPRKLGIEPGEDMLAALEARLSYLDVGSSELADLRTRAMRGEAGEIYVDFSQAKKREQLALAAPSDTAADDAERNSDTAIDDASAENIVEEAYDAGTVCLRISATAANARAGQMLWTVDGIDPSAMPEAGRSLVVVEQSAAFGAFVTGSDDEMTVGGVASRMADGAGSEQADQMIERLPVGVCGLDEEGRILYLNRRLANWLGGEPQDFASGTLELADLIVGDGMNGEVKLKVKGGEPIKCFVTHSINAPGTGPIRSQAVVFPDPMPAHEWEHALAETERRVRWFFDDSPLSIVLADMSGTVTDANRAFIETAGQRHERVIGRSILELILPEDRDEVARYLSKAVMGMGKGGQIEARLQGSRGVAAQIYLQRVAGRSGEAGALLLNFLDTTEQKNLEEQFAQSQKMQAVGQLAGGVAHDFNNLLTAMIGFCDLLLSRHGPGDPSFADIMQIKQNANRAANLVRQLLAFSRRQTLQPKIINITDALAEMSNLLRRLIGEKIDLKVSHGRDIGLVKVDPGQLDQVIINLVVNARDAMAANGGTLTVQTGTEIVDEARNTGTELIPPGDYIRIEVSDTGIGIPKDNLTRIFEPFFSTKQRGEGTGLGLSTVYGIVKQTGGFVAVQSEPGVGTTFTIYLPHYEATEEELAETRAVAEEAPSRDLTGTGAILLVEDEDAVRTFGARALRGKGYDVLEANNGDNALEVLAKTDKTIDLVISDVVMPGIDGPTLIRMLREKRPDLRVIFISGYAEDTYRDELDEENGVHFLPKPFSLKELATKVKEVL